MSYYAPTPGPQGQPDEVLDVHGYTVLECKSALDDLLHTSAGMHVRVIVGKGTRSEYGPVLPVFVSNYLNERDIRWCTAHARDGGVGAYEVFL
jgi:DNA-nicking Smr family endonuclease